MITLDRASVTFDRRIALHPLSLTLKEGEHLALLGANGSGKSTLLRLLHGLQMPSEGRRIKTSPGREAMVFQQPHMLRLSTLNNVRLGLWFSGWRWREATQRAREALAAHGLAALIPCNAHALSVGQRQRLALVRAWALEPRILFLDEPTASLDPVARREVEVLMARWMAAGCTVVWSTHQWAQARRLASRVIYLEQGRVLVDLPKDAFFDDTKPHRATDFLKESL